MSPKWTQTLNPLLSYASKAQPQSSKVDPKLVEQELLKLLCDPEGPTCARLSGTNNILGANTGGGVGGSGRWAAGSLVTALSSRVVGLGSGGDGGGFGATGGGAPEEVSPLLLGLQDESAQAAAAAGVQRLLAAGRRVDAVAAAAAAGLWGLALLLASTCPPPLFAETATALAQVPGSTHSSQWLMLCAPPVTPFLNILCGGKGSTACIHP